MTRGSVLKNYSKIVGSKKIDKLLHDYKPYAGRRVAFINSTSRGGGVAEMLKSFVPMLNYVGIRAKWHVLKGDEPFFGATKRIHNGLQGKIYSCEESGEINNCYCDFFDNKERFLNLNKKLYKDFIRNYYDLIQIDDSQPAPLIKQFKNGKPWVFRLHVHTNSPDEGIRKTVHDFVKNYNLGIVSMKEYGSGFGNTIP